MYERLAEPIRKYIRDKRWEALRPIQNAAIQHILDSEKHIILAAHTASGKTEAAFLPILSKVSFKDHSVKVLYISPLIALINDQFKRVEELCAYLEVPVTKWHGEASKSLKDQLIKNPEGVLLITPESLEAMLDNAPVKAATLFKVLDFTIIDEIHAFSGTDRGLQLKSLLSRIKQLTNHPFRIVGLSATIGEFATVKQMTGEPENTLVLRDKNKKVMEANFKYFQSEGADLPSKLIEDLYEKTKDHKTLIFPNSRGRAEEVAVRLKKIAERTQGHPYYFSHHSSIDKELREYIEYFVKENKRYPFAISCTSTLELGIDIGTVDLVVQIDAAHSVSSLVQRTGRSGRKDGDSSQLLCYATDPWSLLQSLACLLLYRREFIEPANPSERPYDIFVHQLLALVRQHSGTGFPRLSEELKKNQAFQTIPITDYPEIVRELLKNDQLELIGNELIIGIKGERTVNSRDFYSMFSTEPNFKVYHQARAIGEIPLAALIKEDENILLAAKIWKITEIDYKAKKIAVIPAHDGKKPQFFGSGGDIHPQVRQEMLDLLCSSESYPELDEPATEALQKLRKDFKNYPIVDTQTERPVVSKISETILYTFQGTKINQSLQFLFNQLQIESTYADHDSSFHLRLGPQELPQALKGAKELLPQAPKAIEQLLETNPEVIAVSKWGHLLPVRYQAAVIQQKCYDFEGLAHFLDHIHLIHTNEP
jgi:ATP-dependent helicase Lhr and Lhr-like helicase